MTETASENAGTVRPGILGSLRVLDLTDEVAVNGPRLLAAMGADVVRPEPAAGDVLRDRYPLAPRKDGEGELSLAHVLYNAGKRSVVVAPGEAGHEKLERLAAAADVVIASEGSPYFGFVGGSREEFAARHPGCALVVVDHFAADSAFRGREVTDLIINAASGFSWFCGAADGAPEHPKGQLAYSYLGASAAMAAMMGVVARDRHGKAGWYSLAAQEAFAFSTCQSADPNQYRWHNTIPGRLMWTGTQRRALHMCGDGTPCTFVMQGPHWEKLAEWFCETGIGEEFLAEEWLDRAYFIGHQAEMIEAIDQLCQRYERDELVRRGQSMRLMVMPVNAALDMLADPQLRAREMFVETETQVGTLEMLRAPVVSSQPGVLVPPSRPPEIGEHDEVVRQEWTPRDEPRAEVSQAQRLPLAGIRVADFSWMLAGPLATRFLGDMGADVVRIESHTRRDAVREIGPQPPDTYTLDTNSTYHQGACNKRSIALDMHYPEGVAVAREIIAKSDIVFDNFAPGAMGRWGLDAEWLLREWPHLIVVSQPAVGSSGPHSHWGAIGNGVAGYAGLNAITGFPENPPWGLGPIVADQVAPLFTATAILTALHEREKTGRGQYIDCGMLESNTWALDTTLLEAQITGENPARTGNRSGWMSPHGFFRCAGEDEWVAVAVRTDEEWGKAAAVLGLGDAPKDGRFASFAGRKANEDELEQLVSAATRSLDRWEVAGALQEAGVPAAALENIADHLERDRAMMRCFTRTPHPHGFEFLVRNQFVTVNGQCVPNERAPLLGEQSDDILRGLLGKTDEEVAELIAAGALN